MAFLWFVMCCFFNLEFSHFAAPPPPENNVAGNEPIMVDRYNWQLRHRKGLLSMKGFNSGKFFHFAIVCLFLKLHHLSFTLYPSLPLFSWFVPSTSTLSLPLVFPSLQPLIPEFNANCSTPRVLITINDFHWFQWFSLFKHKWYFKGTPSHAFVRCIPVLRWIRYQQAPPLSKSAHSSGRP